MSLQGKYSQQCSKQGEVQRVCHSCRRKKVHCNGGQMPGNRCSNCIAYNYECTYIETSKKRVSPKEYAEGLERRLEKMEKLLNRLCSNTDLSKELGDKIDKEHFVAERNDAIRDSMYKVQVSSNDGCPNSNIGITQTVIGLDDLDPSDDETTAQQSLVRQLEKVKLNPSYVRFLGKSSDISFVRTIVDLKHKYVGIDPLRSRPFGGPIFPRRRPQFWTPHPWFPMEDNKTPHENFPEDDLMASLIDLYFERSNCYLPVLHRPTFEQCIHDGLHYTDEGFGSTLLLVCAIGSRFSDDPRVFLENYDNDTHSCGWKWFQQVQAVHRSLLEPPRLYDLQIYCLMTIFLQSSSVPQSKACWTIIGIGIRLAQDLGVHRRKVYNPVLTVEEELWKRAFWVLVSLDRLRSAGLGRPCAIHDEDFDLDLPVECDDEYWTNPDPALAFKQPAGKPSKMAFFNCSLQLSQILSFALRTIYSINKSKALLGFVGPQWEQHIVAELDSALNKWIDAVPDHLRWNPNREDIVFFNQSAHLYASYYQLRIAVHRPFIPSPRKPSPLTFPSLAICTNAARSCIHVLDVQFKRTGIPHNQNHMCQFALFNSGIVLLLSIWGGKRSGLTTDPEKEMADVHKCMNMLTALESRWLTAGRLRDVLYELIYAGDLPLPQASSVPGRTPEINPCSYMVPSPQPNAGIQARTNECPDVAGPKRVSENTSRTVIPLSSFQEPQSLPPPIQLPPTPTLNPVSSFVLPLHSDELGQLPLQPNLHAPPHDDGWYTPLSVPSQTVPLHINSQPEAGPSSSATGMYGLNNHGTFDAYMNSILDMQPSNVYGQTISSLGTLLPHPDQQPHPPDPHEYMQHMQFMSNGMNPGIDVPLDTIFDNDTLTMWSVTPTGLEWDDWNTYITNLGGMTNVTDTTQQFGDDTQK